MNKGFTVKTAKNQNGEIQNGDKKWLDCAKLSTFKQLIRAYIIIAVQSNIKHILKVTSQPQQLITK